jgi:predicted phosphodiesterase
MNKPSFKSDIARNYVKKFTSTSSLSLAKKMYIENIETFTNVEDARSFIRRIRGLSGKKKRKEIKDKSLFVKPYSLGNPFKLPSSDAIKAKVFGLPKTCDNILFISDLHIPYHDIQAITLAIQYGKEHNINCIFINGDLLDFFMMSRFMKTAKRRSTKGELEIANEFLDILNKEFPTVPIYFLKGNHDNRLEHYLAEKAVELLDMEEFRLEYLLNAQRHNMKVLEDTVLVKIGKLAVTHGHLLIRGIFAPVSAARGAFLRAKSSVIISHVHKVSTHSETTINNKPIICYSTGCLCELNPDYNPFGNNFSHGFAHVKVGEAGKFSVRNLQIIDGVLIN